MKKVASSYVSLEKSTIEIYDRKMVGNIKIKIKVWMTLNFFLVRA